MDKQEIEHMISAEVKKQLKIFAKKLNNDINTLLQKSEARINATHKKELENLRESLKRTTDRVDKTENTLNETNNRLTETNTQIVLAGDSQRLQTKKMIVSVGSQIQKQVYDSVNKKLQTEVIPKLQNMVQMVNYHTEDTTDLVNSYRMAVHNQDNEIQHNMLTDGTDKRVITQHISTVFSYDSDEE